MAIGLSIETCIPNPPQTTFKVVNVPTHALTAPSLGTA